MIKLLIVAANLVCGLSRKHDMCLQSELPVFFDRFQLSTDRDDTEASGIRAAIVDDTDDEVVFVGGFVGSQPLLAKLETTTMSFIWMQGL